MIRNFLRRLYTNYFYNIIIEKNIKTLREDIILKKNQFLISL